MPGRSPTSDSSVGPRDLGTADAGEPILAALLAATAEDGSCLGVTGLDVAGLTRVLLDRHAWAPWRPGAAGRALDDYLEAQINGGVGLSRDVAALVVDPSFRDTDTGHALATIARRHRIDLVFHGGFALPVEGVDPEFRGPAIPPLAARVHAEFARPGELIDAALVGRAAASVVREPHRWADRGPTADTLQHLKQLWHVLVRYGAPRT